MKYLLDVNMLVAWAWCDHPAHEKVTRWVALRKRHADDVVLTVPMVRLGFVRISHHYRKNTESPREIGLMLEGLLEGLGKHHRALADDASGTRFPDWCKSANQTTDAHLLALAAMHGAKLATLDAGIPGALMVG